MLLNLLFRVYDILNTFIRTPKIAVIFIKFISIIKRWYTNIK